MRRPHVRDILLAPHAQVLRRWLPVVIGVCACGVLAPGAPATSPRPLAGITDATTGLPDSSSVVALDVCGTPTATRAACLAQVLAVRGSRALVHPRLRPPSSPYRLRVRSANRGKSAALSGVAAASGATASAVAASGVPASAAAAAAAPQPGTPAYLQQAYDLSYLSQSVPQTAGGATIALVVAYNAPNAEADLATYRAEFSLPPCTTVNGCFKKVDQNGGTNYPSTTDSSWETEASLDVDAVSALCPLCHIILVEAASNSVSDLAAAQAQAAQQGAGVISDSWAFAQTGRAAQNSFATSGPWTFPQITTVAATGDAGYPGPHTGTDYFPAALGAVAAAGGTSLVPASTSGVSSPRNFDEYAWSGAGSGCALTVAKPIWQTDTGCTQRAYADLSADADPNSGMQVYDSDAGGWIVSGGTSEASALIAAYYVLVGAAAHGPSWAYANSALLNDPTSGSNGLCSISITYICNAEPGYDGPTGVGSISGAVTSGAPGIGGPGPSGSYTLSTTDLTARLQGGVYPNGADTTYWWEYGTTTAYGQQTSATDIGSGNRPVTASAALNGLQAGTTYHYRLVAENSFGTEYGYDYTLTTAAEPANTSTHGSTTGATAASPTTPPLTPAAGGPAGTTGPPAVGPPRVTAAGASTATDLTTVATGAAAAYSVQYGTTPAVSQRLEGRLGAASTALSRTLPGLAPGRIYYVRVVVSNSAGSATSTTIRFRTSPVTITRLAVRQGRLLAVLRCHGRALCRVRLQAHARSRLIAARPVAIGGNRSATVTLTLSRAFVASLSISHRRPPVKLSVLSSWNGIRATVTGTV